MRQRIIAFLLLLVVAFTVVNPLWECRDHLDNLRHLGGSHGVLLVILLVAWAGFSLLQSVRLFSLGELCSALQHTAQLFALLRGKSQDFSINLNSGLPPLLPLRV